MKALEEKTKHNYEPALRKRMLLLPKAFYYWGSRKTATLEARIEDIQ